MKKLLLTALLFFMPPVFAADLDEMIGQMLIVGFNGNTANSKGFKTVLKQIDNNEISGVIFFEDNIKNKNEFLKMTNAIKNSRAKIKPFISIDMEGGHVQRMNENNGYKRFKTAKQLSKLTKEAAYQEYSEMAKILKESNINLNFAPCVDLAINPESIVEKKERSYSDNPEIVSQYAKEFIKSHYENGIISSVKHFPGHGSPTGDTHLGFVDISETYTKEELIPFYETVNLYPLQMVMVSHLFNKNMDDNYPASLSYKTIQNYLKPFYSGVVISDDLDMGAIRKNFALEEIVVNAIMAGEDILLFSNRKNADKNLVKNIKYMVNKAVVNNEISYDMIQASYNKIINLKQQLD